MEAKDIVRAVAGFAVYLFLVPVLLFISAGTIDWPMAWIFVAMLFVATLGSRLIVLQRNPDTLRERARFTTVQGTKCGDRVLVMIVGLFGPMATVLVAGLNRRWGWSHRVPAVGQYAAALIVAAGYGLSVWAMVVNRYFSAVARIQEDRDQSVVTSGPYRFVRHPGYVGALLASLALPAMLDALWAIVPALMTGIALIVRTNLEDQMLRDDLDGYQRYAERTAYRLIPGVW